MRQLKRQLLPLLLSIVFGVLAIQPVSGIQAQSTPEDEPPFISGGLAWSPDGEMIAVGTSEGVWLHSADDLHIIRQIPTQFAVTSLDWSPDGERIASGQRSGTVQVWDVSTAQEVFNLQGHTRIVATVSWSPDGTMIASNGWDNTVYIWDAESGELILNIDHQFSTTVTSIAWSPNSQQIVLNGYSRLAIWDVLSGVETLAWGVAAHSIQWSPDGSMLASASSSGVVRLWDASTGELLNTLGENELGIYLVSWKPASSIFITDGEGEDEGWDITKPRIMNVWDATTGNLIAEFEGGILLTYFLDMVAWSPDGTRFVSLSDDGGVMEWEMENYQLIATYRDYKPHYPLIGD